MKDLAVMGLVAAAVVLSTIVGAQSPQSQGSAVTGDAQRGRALFNDIYGCGSCHGVYGIAGNPRLVPVRRTQAAFIAYLRKPTAATMPAFADATEQQLADVFAYLRSIPEPNPPPVQNIPILNDIIKTIPEASPVSR